MITSIFICLGLCLSLSAWGQDPSQDEDLDPASQEALSKTQYLLHDKKKRDEAISKDAKAQNADAFVKKITGGDSKLDSEVYALAADVFAAVVKDAKGDPAKMKEAMDRFSKNPEGFASKWTPEQRAKLKQLSEKIPQAHLLK